MKKISEHLGQIIVALAAIALLVSALALFSEPISDFFGGILDKQSNIGQDMMDSIGVAQSGNEYTTVTGAYIVANDVSSKPHDLKVSLSSDTVTDFSDVYLKRTGKNLLDVTDFVIGTNVSDFQVDAATGSLEFVKTTGASTQGDVHATIYLPAGTYTFSGNSTSDDGKASAFLIRKPNYGAVVKNFDSFNSNPSNNINTSFTFSIEEAGQYEIHFMPNYTSEENTKVEMSNLQLEFGNMNTDFESFTKQTVMANTNGSVSGLTSVSPNMTIIADNADVQISCRYLKKK